jgi:cyclohexyl-isocyanide hydratase
MTADATGLGASFALLNGPGSNPESSGGGAQLQIAALIYPNMVLLDLLGPHTVFNLLRGNVHLVAKDLAPVRVDVGYSIAPTMTLAECPMELDILFVPGGLEGTVALMDDPEVLGF